jgi:hypothetical protein
MQAGKADKQPPPTQLVTLLMQTPQLYARNAVRTSVSAAAVMKLDGLQGLHYGASNKLLYAGRSGRSSTGCLKSFDCCQQF